MKNTIEKAKALLASNPIEGLKLFCTIISECSLLELEDIYKSANAIPSEELAIANFRSFLLCQLIENENSPKELKDKCFRDIISMLKSDDLEIVNSVFSKIQYSLVGFEHEKYHLLHIYLNKTKKITVLKDFFYEFKDPRYIFDFIVRMYEVQGFRLSLELFSDTVEHFWRTTRAETEIQILNLFSQKEFGMLAVKIIASPHSYTYPVDLLKLTSQEEQKTAIECICRYPHSIDRLLRMLLQLRFSDYKEVKVYLQSKLAELIFETYHGTLLDLIENGITKSALDKRFITPLKRAFQAYEEMKLFKDEVKDINPWENEKDLVNLYYGLEHETQALMMKDRQKDSSFLSMLKNTIIVRGNAWKHENDNAIRPLAHIQTSTLVDSRLYKNPIAYEQELDNF